jgi:hypothetical protein
MSNWLTIVFLLFFSKRGQQCDCVAGYEGSLCQHNIDDCANMPCQHSGTCTDELKDYECQCPTGYDGLRYIQWNLSNPTHKGTREMCRIVQDVRILPIYFS